MSKISIKANGRPVLPKPKRPVIQAKRPDLKQPRAPVVQEMPAEQALTFACLLLDEELLQAQTDEQAVQEWIREVRAARQALARLKSELSSPAEAWPA